jgi:tetratricopeptide (TPR) repeat protein
MKESAGKNFVWAEACPGGAQREGPTGRAAPSPFCRFSTLHSPLITILLALCLVIVATGCSRQAKLERHLARGQDFFKAEQYSKSEIEFLNVLRLDPANAVALRDLGLTYYQQGKWLRSYTYLKKAGEVAPANNEIQLRLAGILVGLRNPKDARVHAEAVLSRDPANDEALILLAETTRSTNELAVTRRQLEASRARAETRSGFHLALGILEARQGRTNEAAASFQRALALDPQSVPVHLALGYLYGLNNSQAEFHMKKAAELAPVRSSHRLQYADFKLRSGDPSAAKASLEDITKNAPDYVPAYSRLAEIALAERDFDHADMMSKKILNLDPDNYDGMLLSARVRVGKGDAGGAVTEFDRLVTAYPKIPTAHYHLATAHVRNNNLVKASSELQQALALDPKHTDAVLLLAEINIRQNNAAAAVGPLRQLVREHPELFQAHLALARAYRAVNQKDSASQVYETMTKLFPRSAQPHFAWAQLLLAERKQDDARQKLETAVTLVPGFFPAVEELVNLDVAAGKFSAAEKRIADELARNPKAAGLHLLNGRIHSAQKNYAAAEQAFSRAIEIEADYDAAHLALARVRLDSNRAQAAIDTLSALLARSTNNVGAWLQLGLIHHELKNYAAARDAYERVLVIDPRVFIALNNLASLYCENLNQLDRAETLARAGRNLRPDDPVVSDTLGWILFKRGDHFAALPLFQQSADALPTSAEVQFHLGMTHYMLGNAPAARAALERSLADGQDFPGKPEAQSKLAFLSKSSAEPVSIEVLEKQLATNPQDPFILARLAAAYEQSGAFDKAAAVYNSAIQQNPRNVSAMLKVAQLYAGPLRDPAKALQIARNARTVAPDDRAVAQTLGRLAFQSGDYKWSLSLLEDGARDISDQPEPLYDLAWARYSAGRVADAVTAMNKALGAGKPFEKSGDAQRFVEMNALAVGSEKTAAAATRVESALKQDSSYVPALFASAVLQQRAGNVPVARDQYEAILKRFPDFTPAHKGMAVLLSKSSSNIDTAFKHATRAREALPDDPEVARALGIISFHRKDYARSAQLLKQASLKVPTDAETFYYLGMAYFHSKDKANCRAALQQALSLSTNAPFAVEAKRVLAELK